MWPRDDRVNTPGKFKTHHYILSIDSCFQGNTYSNSRDDHLLYSIHVPFQGVIASVLAHSLRHFPTFIVVDCSPGHEGLLCCLDVGPRDFQHQDNHMFRPEDIH